MMVDTSESIRNLVGSYVNCINNVIGTQRALNPRARFTLYTFNDSIRTKCCNIPITALSPIQPIDLAPRGCTALYQAVHIALTKNFANPNPTIFIIVTDGEDNCSPIKVSLVKSTVQELQKRGWFFVFLGASPYANFIGKSMGISDCVLYSNTAESIQKVGDAINIAISKATAMVTGVPNAFSSQDMPGDVRELMESIEEMKIK